MSVPQPALVLLGIRAFCPILNHRMSEYANKSEVSCGAVGLSCEECTSQTATELARTCTGLRGKMVSQLFVQLDPEPGCARMHAHFAACYRAASREAVRDVWEDVPSRTLIAVA